MYTIFLNIVDHALTLYSCATDIPSVALELQASATKITLLRWFESNHLKLIKKKSHTS